MDPPKKHVINEKVNVMFQLHAAMPHSSPVLSVPRPSLHLTQLTASLVRLLLHHHVLPTMQQLQLNNSHICRQQYL